MEVKIKNGNEMVDATIEMVGDVMLVSPKKVLGPKDGDILVGGNWTEDGGNYWIFILKGEIKDEFDGCMSANEYASVEKSGSLEIDSDSDSMKWYRPATEKEKKLLFDKLAEEGWEWKADTKELVKLKPKEGEEFWLPLYYTSPSEFGPIKSLLNKGRDKAILDKDWCFKTKQECQAFCDRLNDAINSVKP